MSRTNLPAFVRIYPETAIAEVACPRCGAKKGEGCISSSVPRTHHERMDAAETVVAQAFAEQKS